MNPINLLFSLIKAAPSLFIIALLLSILSHLRNKSTKSFEKSKQDFWDRERAANAVRKKDISNLPYVEIPSEIISCAKDYADTSDDYANKDHYLNTLESLVGKKILNLNGKSNTDIKLEYGTANITVLSDADNNYTELISVLSRLGEAFYDRDRFDEARHILEFSVDAESDVVKSYKILMDIYGKTMSEADRDEAIKTLHEKAEKLNGFRKDAVLALFVSDENTREATERTDNG